MGNHDIKYSRSKLRSRAEVRTVLGLRCNQRTRLESEIRRFHENAVNNSILSSLSAKNDFVRAR